MFFTSCKLVECEYCNTCNSWGLGAEENQRGPGSMPLVGVQGGFAP